MLKIAVCDDDDSIIKTIGDFLYDYGRENDITFEIFCFSDGTDLLASKQRFDLIFLDIEMRHINGLDAAVSIRETDMNVKIIYITNHTAYFERAFKVHAFDYITKPLSQERLLDVMNDYFASLHDISDLTMQFLTSDGFVNVKLNDIYSFFAEAKKKILMHTIDGDIMIFENLRDIYNKLDKTQFYMTKRGSIVNLRHVKRLKNDGVIIMKDGSWMALAVNKKEEFTKKLSSILVDKLKGQ